MAKLIREVFYDCGCDGCFDSPRNCKACKYSYMGEIFYCPKCKREIELRDGVKYCPYCGEKVEK